MPISTPGPCTEKMRMNASRSAGVTARKQGTQSARHRIFRDDTAHSNLIARIRCCRETFPALVGAVDTSCAKDPHRADCHLNAIRMRKAGDSVSQERNVLETLRIALALRKSIAGNEIDGPRFLIGRRRVVKKALKWSFGNIFFDQLPQLELHNVVRMLCYCGYDYCVACRSTSLFRDATAARHCARTRPIRATTSTC